MFALISPEQIHPMAGAVVRLLATWQRTRRCVSSGGDASILV